MNSAITVPAPKTPEELRYEGALLVFKWLETLCKEGYRKVDPDLILSLRCDLDHSSLMRWLCRGNEPLNEVPPLRFSRPDHQAYKDGVFQPLEVWFDSLSNRLIVDQESWCILKKVGVNSWLATHRAHALPNGEAEWSQSCWHIRSIESENGQLWEARRISASMVVISDP